MSEEEKKFCHTTGSAAAAEPEASGASTTAEASLSLK
jgi:hypothetical protein